MCCIHRAFSTLIAIACLSLPYLHNTYSAKAQDSDLSYRLPTSIHPEYYRVSILTNLADYDQNFTFIGRVWIQIKCDEPTNRIILHSKKLDIDEETVAVTRLAKPVFDEETGEKSGSHSEDTAIQIRNHCYHEDYDFYIITLAEDMKPGVTYSVLINYSGELTQGLAGYYRSSYKDLKTGETRWLAVTQFESTDARRALPCFDEPAFKARFEVRLGHVNYRTSISNMRIANTAPVPNMPNWVWDQYEVTVPMSTYLLAFVVSDFNYKVSPKINSNDVAFRVWARKDAINQVDYAAIIGPRVLEHFEHYFDVKYPLPKLDMIAIPDFSSGAMENWGLITYREVALLYDPAVSTASSQPYVASVIAHEIAHQWFGNLVTMKWWTDLWLNEGFATYVAALGVNYLHPEWDSLDEEVVDNMMSVFALDSLKSSHPISVPIGHPREIAQIFDTISYKKVALKTEPCFRRGPAMNVTTLRQTKLRGKRPEVICEISKSKNNKTFFRFICPKDDELILSNAEQDDLWQSLTEEAHSNQALPSYMTVKRIMDSWTLQTGYPLITVVRNYETGAAAVYQERFLADKANAQDRDESQPSRWWVPLSYTWESEGNFENTRPKEWLASNQNSVVIQGLPKNDWVIFNIQVAGLYKVKYDNENWNRLINTLLTDHTKIGMLNRVLLIDDSLELAKTGDIDYTIPFNIIRYLQFEEEYLPWKAALRNLGFVDKMLRFYPTYGYFRAFINNLLKDIYKKTSEKVYENTPENLTNIKHQSLIAAWACKFGVGNCKEKAIAMFQQWMEQGTPIPKDSQSYIYCTAIRYGGEKEWNFLWNQYLQSNVGNERSLILSTLSCTREIWLLNRYLEWSIDESSGVRKQDSPSVFAGIARGDIGYFLAKSFCKNRLQDISDFFGPKATKVGSFVGILANQITSQSDFEEVAGFVGNNQDLFHSSMQAVKQGLENAKINIQWQQKFYYGISEYLRAQVMGK